MFFLQRVVVIFIGALHVLFTAWATDAKQYPQLLRDQNAPCGFYLARLSSEFTGRRLTDTLDPTELKNALLSEQSLHSFDPSAEALVAVGTPPDWMSRRQLQRKIFKMFDEAGYPSVKYTAIRQVTPFIASKIGVFVQRPHGEMVRISGLNGDEISQSLTGPKLEEIFREGGALVISGLPLVGPRRTQMTKDIVHKLKAQAEAQNVGQEWSENSLKTRSRLGVWVSAFVENPKKTFFDAWHKALSIFPLPEDMVRPTQGEMRSMGQKVVMHTVLSVVTLGIKGDPLQVLIPVTVVNAGNSATTGTYRSFIGNWMSRDGNSQLARFVKGVMLSSFFTFDLYLAKNAFNGDVLRSLTEFSGWINFMSNQWVSVLFQVLWRSPVYSVLHQWERWRSAQGGPDLSQWARTTAGNAEKYMTYLMTQLYLVSILMKTSFFHLTWKTQEGLQLVSGSPPENLSALDQTLLLNFNAGHLGMALVGASAYGMQKHYQLFDKVAPAVEWLDRKENNFYRAFLALFQKKESP